MARPVRLIRPVRIKVENLNFNSGWRKDQANLAHLASDPTDQPVVLMLQEAKNLLGAHTLTTLLGALWAGLTGNTPATAGTAIYARGVKVFRLHQWLLGKYPGLLPRWVTQGRLKVPGGAIRLLSVHVPRKASGRTAQLAAIARVRGKTASARAAGMGWIVAADFNMPVVDVARMLGGVAYGQARGHGIVGFVCSPGVIVTGSGSDRFGLNQGLTDHPGEWIDVVGLRK